MKLPVRFATCALAVSLLAMAVERACAAGPEPRSLLPAGGQRGTTVEVTASGKFPKWPVQTWVDRTGLAITPSADKGKLSIAVSPQAVGGVYWIRLFDADGAAAPLPFIVGTLPEVLEQEPNSSVSKAQTLSSSAVVVNGKLGGNGDVDIFAVPLQAGQILVASLEGHETIGSPVDSVLQILSARGHVLAYNHDQHGLDPQIVFTSPAAGNYLVRVFGFPSTPNQTIGFAGGDQYVYRLTLTTGPFVDYPWPLAVTRGRETQVELFGWNIPNPLKSLLVRPTGERADIFDAQLANVASVAVEGHETIVEVEPNSASNAQPIELPITVSGRIESRRDVDVFSFAGHKDEALTFQLESRALGYPLDAVLEVTDVAGKSLARVDDVGQQRDAVLAFSPPSDGQYRIAVSDLNHDGSSRHVYRLRATKTQPDFEVAVDAHSYIVTPGKSTEITLAVDRRNGFEVDIALAVVGLPPFVAATSAISAGKGETAKALKITLTATAGAFSGPIRITCESPDPTKRSHLAEFPLAAQSGRTSDLWLTVAPATSQ